MCIKCAQMLSKWLFSPEGAIFAGKGQQSWLIVQHDAICCRCSTACPAAVNIRQPDRISLHFAAHCARCDCIRKSEIPIRRVFANRCPLVKMFHCIVMLAKYTCLFTFLSTVYSGAKVCASFKVLLSHSYL